MDSIRPCIPFFRIDLGNAFPDGTVSLKPTSKPNLPYSISPFHLQSVSLQDVLREMKELKPASSSSSPDGDDASADEVDDDDDDLGDDLSPEELEVAKMVADIVSETLTVVKEVMRGITGMIKVENPEDDGEFVDWFEKLLKLCQGIGVEIDELGACVYPPQELSLMKETVERVRGYVGEIEDDVVKGFKNSSSSSSSSEDFLGTCIRLKSLIEHMVTEMETRIDAQVVSKLHNVTL